MMLLDSANTQSQTHYAVVKLNEAARIIGQLINELPILRKRLDKHKNDNAKAREIYDNLQQQRKKLLDSINTATLALQEVELTNLSRYSAKLVTSIKAFNLMTPDYQKLCSTLSDYISQLPIADTPDAKTTNAAIIGRLMNNVKVGYYPTDLEHINHIARGIEFPDNITVNLLDPCCGCGLALNAMAAHKDCVTYGVEIDRYRAEEALTRLNRVGFGSYFHSRVAHESFHAILLNPPYLSVMTENGNNTRSEKRFLVDSMCHLMYGGLLMYIVPYYRLTADICRVFCDNFDDITVWKFTGSEFKKYKQIVVMGTRQKRQNRQEAAQALSLLALEPDMVPEVTALPDSRYQLPVYTKKVDLFKGSEYNVTELFEQLKKSTSFSRLFERSQLDNSTKRPLLPLNIGQVGLIGGSGLINGLVDCDTPHIVKGRVIKSNNTSREENINSRGELISTTIHETRSNRMLFNILTPDGFRTLL